MKVTISVVMDTPDGGEHTVTRSTVLHGDDNPVFKGHVAELGISQLGRLIVDEIVSVHGKPPMSEAMRQTLTRRAQQ